MKYTDKEYDLQTLSPIISDDTMRVIAESEEFYHKQITNAATLVAGKRIVLLSGPSGSGKTTTANKLCAELQARGIKSVVVSLDNFYHNREHLPIIDGKPNAEVVEALSVSLIHSIMEDILDDGHTFLPFYDFITGIRTNGVTETNVGMNGIVIFEGIHALNPKINKGLDPNKLFKIYVSPHSSFFDDTFFLSRREMRFIRRMTRDSWSRGTVPERTMEMWPIVCAGEDTLIKPFSTDADLHINTTHAYEPFIMRDTAINLLLSVKKDNTHYETAQRYIKKLVHFSQIDTKLLPKDSLLREFINP